MNGRSSNLRLAARMLFAAGACLLAAATDAQLPFRAAEPCDSVLQASPSWCTLPETAPDETGYAAGVSAQFAGTAGGALIVAGGANFPATPAAEGGAKAFYDGIYAWRDGTWSRIGTLPVPAAYGVTFTTRNGLVFAGGAHAAGALRTVLRLRPEGDHARVSELPPLPVAVEQAAGAAIGCKLYLAGGLAGGKPSAALLVLDTRAANPQWRTLAPVPEAFVQPVMAASNGRLYLWGGFNPHDASVSGNGYCYDPATDRWREIPGPPDGGTLTGSCAATLADGRIVCMGGVDRVIFAAALRLPAGKQRAYLSQPAAAYRFRREVWIFDPSAERWSSAGASARTARAGAALVPHADGLYLLGGEIKPGVRTPENLRTESLNQPIKQAYEPNPNQ